VDAVILSGGLGTRLYPLTFKRPKSIIDFLDRPLVDYQLDIAEQIRCEAVVMALGHLSAAVEETCRRYGGAAAMRFVSEDEPLGTGGALANALREGGVEGPAIVLNGDIICDISPRSLLDTHQRSGAQMTLVGAPVRDPQAYGTLQFSQERMVIGFCEKAPPQEPRKLTYINAGIYLLSAEACTQLRETSGAFSLERDFFPQLAAEGKIAAHLHQGFWRDVGTLGSYFNAHFDVLSYFLMMGTANFGGRRTDFTLFRDLIYINNSVKLGDKCDLFHRVTLMSGVKVGSNCRLRNCILLPGAEVGDDCVLETVMVDRGTTIADGSELESELRSGDRAEPFSG
jgi:NDP-sugar pyrophosphorylase family protein